MLRSDEREGGGGFASGSDQLQWLLSQALRFADVEEWRRLCPSVGSSLFCDCMRAHAPLRAPVLLFKECFYTPCVVLRLDVLQGMCEWAHLRGPHASPLNHLGGAHGYLLLPAPPPRLLQHVPKSVCVCHVGCVHRRMHVRRCTCSLLRALLCSLGVRVRLWVCDGHGRHTPVFPRTGVFSAPVLQGAGGGLDSCMCPFVQE